MRLLSDGTSRLLNSSPDELIRAIFFNSANNSLVMVSGIWSSSCVPPRLLRVLIQETPSSSSVLSQSTKRMLTVLCVVGLFIRRECLPLSSSCYLLFSRTPLLHWHLSSYIKRNQLSEWLGMVLSLGWAILEATLFNPAQCLSRMKCSAGQALLNLMKSMVHNFALVSFCGSTADLFTLYGLPEQVITFCAKNQYALTFIKGVDSLLIVLLEPTKSGN